MCIKVLYNITDNTKIQGGGGQYLNQKKLSNYFKKKWVRKTALLSTRLNTIANRKYE